MKINNFIKKQLHIKLTIVLFISLLSLGVFGQKKQIQFDGNHFLVEAFNQANSIQRIDSIHGRNDVCGEFIGVDSTSTFKPDYWDSGILVYYSIFSQKYSIEISLNGCVFFNKNGQPIIVKLENIEGKGYENQLRYIIKCGQFVQVGFATIHATDEYH